MKRTLFLMPATSLVLLGCAIGPNYTAPDLGAPNTYRFGGESRSSLGDLDWRSVYKDPVLRELIEEALANNLDLKAAAARIQQAHANLQVVRSQFFPTIGVAYDYNRSEVSKDIDFKNLDLSAGFDTEQNALGLGMMQYEVDFWGKIRRASESAQALVFATEDARRTLEVSLIASMATAYLTLREQDHELDIARRTLETRKESLGLITTRQQGGQSALTDVKQADVLVAEAEAAIKVIERQIAQLENTLSYLAGRAPDSVRRSRTYQKSSLVSAAPAGLPSDLLTRRPDIRSAEQQLISATANIGVAEARLLPSFTLTASAGLRSKDFSDLFDEPTKLWQIGPAVSVPVFTGGRLLAGIRGSKALRDEAEAAYRRTVLQGLREVSDALSARQKNAGLSAARARIVNSRQDALGLIRESYQNGATSYLEVLYNDQQLFGAELDLARAELDEMLATVQLYRALGGGWDKSTVPTTAKPH